MIVVFIVVMLAVAVVVLVFCLSLIDDWVIGDFSGT